MDNMQLSFDDIFTDFKPMEIKEEHQKPLIPEDIQQEYAHETFDFRNLYEKGDLIYLVRPVNYGDSIRKLRIRTVYQKNMIGCYETGECCCITDKEHQHIFQNNIDAKQFIKNTEETCQGDNE